MQRWVALIRGINVGGRNKLPMSTLRTTLEDAGCQSVSTYIQSGNVVFASKSKSKFKLLKLLGDTIESQFGFRPDIVLLSSEELQSAIQENPFELGESKPNCLHFFFLSTAPASPDMDAIRSLAASTEQFALIGTVFYLFAPDGIGRSKLASAAERKLGVPATARNLSTVLTLSEMLNAD